MQLVTFSLYYFFFASFSALIGSVYLSASISTLIGLLYFIEFGNSLVPVGELFLNFQQTYSHHIQYVYEMEGKRDKEVGV